MTVGEKLPAFLISSSKLVEAIVFFLFFSPPLSTLRLMSPRLPFYSIREYSSFFFLWGGGGLDNTDTRKHCLPWKCSMHFRGFSTGGRAYPLSVQF